MFNTTLKILAAIFASSVASLTAAQSFIASSPDLPSGTTITEKFVLNNFGCTGSNVSPAVIWQNAPSGTKSFAVLVHDPDAQTGGAGFWHWLVLDIPASVSALPMGSGNADGGALPQGTKQINTDFGNAGWGGPCPPVGDKPHRYNFTVYALKVDKLALPPNPTASLAGFIVNANAIGKASFSASYGR